MRSKKALVLVSLAAACVLGAVAAPASPPPSHRAAAAKAVTRSATVQTSYLETDAGADAGGGALKGVTGHGKFSAKLGPAAAVLAHLLAAATGVPFSSLAKGGTYATRFDVDANSGQTGLVAMKYTIKSLGSSCLTFKSKRGKFVQGQSFIPTSGSIQSAGGTGSAASLHGSGTYKQTDVTGSNTEQFSGTTKVKVSKGAAKAPSAKCKALLKLAKG